MSNSIWARGLYYILASFFAACITCGFPTAGARADQAEGDPFAETQPLPATASEQGGALAPQNAETKFFRENFTFKKELYSQFTYGPEEEAQDDAGDDRWYSRQSVGFETLKKFSSANATVAGFNVQARLVRRDNFVPVINDEEGADREGWFLEYHNLYLDLYNVAHPFISDSGKAATLGHFNFRAGRFYLPVGLNLQTDTHGTLLQLSNERNFGFERDWYAGLWGSINPELNYDLYSLLGSGYDPAFRGQNGLFGARVSLSSMFLNEYGIEGGLSVLAGERRGIEAVERSRRVAEAAAEGEFVQTTRVGLDARYTHLLLDGSLTGTLEVTAGEDEPDTVFTQLGQLDYLHRSRTWGTAAQLRRFQQFFSSVDQDRDDADTSLIGEVSYFFRNDIGNTNLHWVKLNLEQQLERMEGSSETIISLQYYRYW